MLLRTLFLSYLFTGCALRVANKNKKDEKADLLTQRALLTKQEEDFKLSDLDAAVGPKYRYPSRGYYMPPYYAPTTTTSTTTTTTTTTTSTTTTTMGSFDGGLHNHPQGDDWKTVCSQEDITVQSVFSSCVSGGLPTVYNSVLKAFNGNFDKCTSHEKSVGKTMSLSRFLGSCVLKQATCFASRWEIIVEILDNCMATDFVSAIQNQWHNCNAFSTGFMEMEKVFETLLAITYNNGCCEHYPALCDIFARLCDGDPGVEDSPTVQHCTVDIHARRRGVAPPAPAPAAMSGYAMFGGFLEDLDAEESTDYMYMGGH